MRYFSGLQLLTIVARWLFIIFCLLELIGWFFCFKYRYIDSSNVSFRYCSKIGGYYAPIMIIMSFVTYSIYIAIKLFPKLINRVGIVYTLLGMIIVAIFSYTIVLWISMALAILVMRPLDL